MSLPEKLRLTGEILVIYCRVRWAMRGEEVSEVVGRIRSWSVANPEPPTRQMRAQLSGALMGVLSFLPTDSRCLVRSLVYLALLVRRGGGGTVVIGVRTDPKFAAHAWVEYEGEALLPSGGGEFAPLTVI